MALKLQKMSAIDYFFLAEELQPLVGGFLNKIYELRPNLFRFKVRADKDYNLIAELGLRMHLSKYAEESPEVPTNFTMLLRKHLENSKITEIKQENDDRLLIFTLRKKEECHLIFEMFAKGNLILTTADYTIIAPYKSEKSKARTVKKMETYVAVPNPNRLPEKPAKQPAIYYDNDHPAAFAPFASEKYGEYKQVAFPTISEMADQYYFEILQIFEKEKGAVLSKDEGGSLKKLEHRLKQQEDAMKRFGPEIESYQKAGNYLYQNFELIENILNSARELKKQKILDPDIEKQLKQKFSLKLQIQKGKLAIEPA